MVFHHLPRLWCWRPQRKRMLGSPADPILCRISQQSLSSKPKPFFFPCPFDNSDIWITLRWNYCSLTWALLKVHDQFKITDQHILDGRSSCAEHANEGLLFIISQNTDTQLVSHHLSLHLHSRDAHIMDMSRMAKWHAGVQRKQNKVKIDQQMFFVYFIPQLDSSFHLSFSLFNCYALAVAAELLAETKRPLVPAAHQGLNCHS